MEHNIMEEPLTYLTKKTVTGKIGFYTEGFTIQEAQLAYRVINRGLHHFLLKNVHKTTINTAGSTGIQQTQYEKIELSDDYKTIQLFKDTPDQLSAEANKLLNFLNIAPAPTEQKPKVERQLLIDACKACITEGVLQNKKVNFDCTLKLARAYFQYEIAHDRLLDIDAPDLVALPALTSQGLSLLQVVRGAIKGDGERITAGILGLLKHIPQVAEIIKIYSFIINVKEGNYFTAILAVIPTSTSLVGLTGAIGIAVGVNVITKFLENSCNWFWSLSRQLVCKFDPHLNGQTGLQVARNIVKIQGGSNVRKLLRDKELIELIKSLGGQSTRHSARLLLEDMAKNRREEVPKLLREMLRVPRELLPDYIESWRYLTRTRSRARVVRRNPDVLDAVTRYRRSPLFAAIKDTMYLVNHFNARTNFGCPDCATFGEDVEFLLQLENIANNRNLLNSVADNFLSECGKNANASKGVNWALELVARTHRNAGITIRNLANRQKIIKEKVDIPSGRKVRPLVGNLMAIEFRKVINNHPNFRDRNYDFILFSNDTIFVDAKNIRLGSINSSNFRNEIKKDLELYQDDTQKRILYLYKKRDIPNADALQEAIFNILTDAQYGFVDLNNPDNGEYLTPLSLRNMGFRGRFIEQIRSFIKQKFILIED